VTDFLYREAVRKELVASIARRQAHARRKWVVRVGAVAACAAAALAVVAFVLTGGANHPTGSVADRSPDHEVFAPHTEQTHANPRSGVTTFQPAIPEQRVSLQQAEQDAGFDVLVPNTELANSNNLTGVYEGDGAGITLRFPTPDPSADVRQPEISIWEAPWTDGDPVAAYKQDLTNDPDPNKSICSVGDLPALCVEAKSPNDATQENPAFVRVVINKLEVELSGGASVQDLREIAGSLPPSGG
jgi:hypothetical protein